jgi:hypothetical protein
MSKSCRDETHVKSKQRKVKQRKVKHRKVKQDNRYRNKTGVGALGEAAYPLHHKKRLSTYIPGKQTAFSGCFSCDYRILKLRLKLINSIILK